MYQALHDNNEHLGRNVSDKVAYWQSLEQSVKTAPEEITLMRFIDQLGVMYPLDWQGNTYSETFKLAEMYCGNVTNIYAKVGERYFTFRDVVMLSHDEIINRIKKEVFDKEEIAKK
ncbi:MULTISPECIES: hypothetical protein [Photorhabdus]|uniref:Uncharacterized protein n=2 Tax=Photorhabdus TaxID=29487 RepID=A0A7X5TN16_9GAMM|nr:MULTISPECIES: hypothetical protein [Photorhabdus]MQL50089.1 hypothetical protein [Photorhabdus khanii]NHB98373.1 hypothetical protein [Photorhabdus stackebrandtii]